MEKCENNSVALYICGGFLVVFIAISVGLFVHTRKLENKIKNINVGNVLYRVSNTDDTTSDDITPL